MSDGPDDNKMLTVKREAWWSDWQADNKTLTVKRGAWLSDGPDDSEKGVLVFIWAG